MSTTYPDLTVTVAGGVAEFRSPYNAGLVTEIKAVPGRRWNPDAKVWSVRVNAASRAAVADLASRAGHVTDPDNALTPTPGFTLPEATAVEVPGPVAASLRAHQAALVAAVQAGARRVLLADEPGLGKTAQALVSIAAAGSYPAVVVCPSVVKTAWAREAARWTPAARVVVLSGRKADPALLADADIAVINYDVLSQWANTLTSWAPHTLILDEGHYAKDSRTARGKAVLVLAEIVRGRDGLVMALTGTPVPNHVIDLVGPLSALGWLNELGGFFGFAKRYCAAYQGSHGWVMNGASNLDELHHRLRELGLVRRVKADLADLPERTVVDLPVALEGQGSRDVKTLHAASNVVLGELPWSAADQDQAIDRVHRLGQDQPVTAWRVLAAGTFDERLADLIGSKAAVSNAVVDGAGYDPAAAQTDRRARVDALTALVLQDRAVARLRAGLADDEDDEGWDEQALAVMAGLLASADVEEQSLAA